MMAMTWRSCPSMAAAGEALIDIVQVQVCISSASVGRRRIFCCERNFKSQKQTTRAAKSESSQLTALIHVRFTFRASEYCW
jgi:hypothetical protein